MIVGGREARRPCVGTRAGRRSGHLRVRIHVDSSGCCHRPGRPCDHDGCSRPTRRRRHGDVHGHRHQRRQPGDGGNRRRSARAPRRWPSGVALNGSGQATFTTVDTDRRHAPDHRHLTAARRAFANEHRHDARPHGRPGGHDDGARLVAQPVDVRPDGDVHGHRHEWRQPGDGRHGRRSPRARPHWHRTSPSTAPGQATFTTSTLAVGVHTITATFNGTTNFATSTGIRSPRWSTASPTPVALTSSAKGASLFLDATGSLAGAGSDVLVGRQRRRDVRRRHDAAPTLTWAQLAGLGITDGTHVSTMVTLRLTDGPTFTAVTPLTVTNVASPTATLGNDGPVDEGFHGDRDIHRAGRSFGRRLRHAGPTATTSTTTATFEVTASSSSSATVPASFLADGSGTRTVHAVVADNDGGFSVNMFTVINDRQRCRRPPRSPGLDGVRRGAVHPQGRCHDRPPPIWPERSGSPSTGATAPSVTVGGPADPPVTHTYGSRGDVQRHGHGDRPRRRIQRL